MNWPIRMVRLSSDPFASGLWCGPDGLMLSGQPLLKKTLSGFEPRTQPELQALFDRTYGEPSLLNAEDYLPGLTSVARSLDRGDLPLAMIGSLLLKLPEPPEDHEPLEPRGSNTEFKLAYSDTELRNELGEWTNGSTNAPRRTLFSDPAKEAPSDSANPEVEIGGAEEAGVAARTLAGRSARLAPFLGRLGGAAVGSLIPTYINNIHEGQLSGFPGLNYRSDEGAVTLERLGANGNIETLYHGLPDKDDFYYDREGHIVGQRIGTSVVFDPDFLADLANKPPTSPRSKPPTSARTDTPLSPATSDTTENDEPRLCPPPTPENINRRSERALAYQRQITGLPDGWDVLYHDVRFDGCVNPVVDFQEAKGPMPSFIVTATEDKIKKFYIYDGVMKQAARQSIAAESHHVDWYFADKALADFFEAEFKGKFPNITVHHVDALIKILNYIASLINEPLWGWNGQACRPALWGMANS